MENDNRGGSYIEAMYLVKEWRDVGGIGEHNKSEMEIFIGLLRHFAVDFYENKIGEGPLEDKVEEISLAIFQLGRAEGRPSISKASKNSVRMDVEMARDDIEIGEAQSLVREWTDLEGITIDNINEMAAFMGLLRAYFQDFSTGEMKGVELEDKVEDISLAIFQLGRAVGRPKHPEGYGDLE